MTIGPAVEGAAPIPGADVEPAGVRASGLTKSYDTVQAVRGIDVVIAPGETVAPLGPNGAGKTTTIDMVLGLTRPDAGSVSVFGVPPATAVRSGLLGGMLQTGSLPDCLRVRELISLVASYYPQPLDVGMCFDARGSPTSRSVGRRSSRVGKRNGCASPRPSSRMLISWCSTSRPLASTSRVDTSSGR